MSEKNSLNKQNNSNVMTSTTDPREELPFPSSNLGNLSEINIELECNKDKFKELQETVHSQAATIDMMEKEIKEAENLLRNFNLHLPELEGTSKPASRGNTLNQCIREMQQQYSILKKKSVPTPPSPPFGTPTSRKRPWLQNQDANIAISEWQRIVDDFSEMLHEFSPPRDSDMQQIFQEIIPLLRDLYQAKHFLFYKNEPLAIRDSWKCLNMICNYGVSKAETIEEDDDDGCDGCNGKTFCVQVKETSNGTAVRLIYCNE
ncbi:hypothetical protein BTUL_0136g00190 [Botrytis tulipae]|uniref:Uncharacterized protein n=1 Tax=Botrytis tulipae TaxID=87230 RepID=A0A4Z1EN21_9HELO|nr:hypothetical protein BTUL_0136g00190 [Botrytis tulipae]